MDVEQDRVGLRDEEEIGEVFALRGQEGGVNDAVFEAAHVIADQPLQKAFAVGAGEGEQAAVGTAFGGHFRLP